MFPFDNIICDEVTMLLVWFFFVLQEIVRGFIVVDAVYFEGIFLLGSRTKSARRLPNFVF